MNNSVHVRSELNKALDQCPAIVQEAVWGEGGFREQIEVLRDALDHIEKVCSGSRTQTRRLRWIGARAKSALNGNDNWRSLDLPKTVDGDTRNYIARKQVEAQNKELLEQIKKLEASLRMLSSDLVALTEQSDGVAGWHQNGEIAKWDEFEGMIKIARGAL